MNEISLLKNKYKFGQASFQLYGEGPAQERTPLMLAGGGGRMSAHILSACQKTPFLITQILHPMTPLQDFDVRFKMFRAQSTQFEDFVHF